MRSPHDWQIPEPAVETVPVDLRSLIKQEHIRKLTALREAINSEDAVVNLDQILTVIITALLDTLTKND